MAIKPRYKRRIGWTLVGVVVAATLALIFIPTAITLNSMKSELASAVLAQTGIQADFRGDIKFSLLGRATVVARDIVVPFGTIDSAAFDVSFHSIFHPHHSELTGPVSLYGAKFKVDSLHTVDFHIPVTMYNSRIDFMSHDYDIIRGELINGRFNGTVRTAQHKYDVTFENDEFIIRNQNNKLEIIGKLFDDGSAAGQFSIDTEDINKWFEFSRPKIDGPVKITMDMQWDGGHGFEFRNIVANNVTGNISLQPNGHRNIQLYSDDIDFDLSFLQEPGNLLFNTNVNVDFHGNLKFGEYTFNHVKISLIGTDDKLQIKNIIADDIALTGGYIDKDGAHDIMLVMPIHGKSSSCLFSGTPQKWQCSEYTNGNLSGSLFVDGDEFDITAYSDIKMPDMNTVQKRAMQFGTHGKVNFVFNDASGTLYIDGKKTRPEFKFAKNKTLDWLGVKLPFLPATMADAVGDVEWESGAVVFRPHDGKWQMAIQNDFFYIYGDDYKVWFPDIDLSFLRDAIYTVSGEYKNKAISDLTINIANHVFTGSAVGNTITLKSDLLNIDSFLQQTYMDKYEELSFLKMHPLMIPFDIGIKLSLSTDKMIFDGIEYNNFVYSLKPNKQTFSITDNARGNILATIVRDGTEYNIELQLNKFKTHGLLLRDTMPLNIEPSYITGDISMTTSGHIAHDIEYNLAGDIDLTFDDGYIYGIGTDAFFAAAENITILNAEYALTDALNDGKTRLKSLHIVGNYNRGNFQTTKPLELSLPHVDATGGLKIEDSAMSAQFYIVMRGTAPEPAPIDLTINANGERIYSLSEIMQNFDPSYMRQFVKNHDRF